MAWRLIDADILINSTIMNPLHAPYITEADVYAQPIIDAKIEQHAKWIRSFDSGRNGTCSRCGERCSSVDWMKYCPHCGAKMDKE